MARYENTLSTLQARTILYFIEKNAPAMYNKYDIENFAFSVVDTMENSFPAQFPINSDSTKENNPHFSYLAFTFSACARYAIKSKCIRPLEYISILADVKETNEKDIHDFGAFGDLYEILVRCAFIRKINLINWTALSVKDINNSDMISRKYGIVEIGHNGKTFTQGTMFDYMYGDYTSIVYGVFSEEDKKEVYRLCKNGEYDKAIEFVCSYSVFWTDKYQFELDMNNLTRGKGITAKGGNIQAVYNPGKYNAFVGALESGLFVSLWDFLKG